MQFRIRPSYKYLGDDDDGGGGLWLTKTGCPGQRAANDDIFYQFYSGPLPLPSMRHLNLIQQYIIKRTVSRGKYFSYNYK